MAIGIAIIGAGIFALEEHLPAIQACPSFVLKAVFSRTQHATEILASSANETIDAYFASPTSEDHTLNHLLARRDIQAVTIALPIAVQPPIIRLALSAGKHVLSEKPIAPDIPAAVSLLNHHRSRPSPQKIWTVGENFRFVEPVLYGAHALKQLDASVVAFSMTLYGFINDNDKFQQTPWRRDFEYPSGTLLDSGIHFVAALRFLLQAAGESITHVAAFTSLLQKRLKPIDTAHATMRLRNSHSGTFSISFGAEFKSAFEIEIVTDKGTVTVTPILVTIISSTRETAEDEDEDEEDANEEDDEEEETPPSAAHPETQTAKRECALDSGVKREMAAFAESIRSGREDPRGKPEEALRDLRVLMAMFESGEEGGAVKEVG